MKAIAIIPARYHSSRFPGKPLALLNEKPLIQHVYENVISARKLDSVIVATDHASIYKTVKTFKCDVIMTSSALSSGTDRVAQVAKKLNYDIIVNVQGDEPLIKGEMIDNTIELLKDKKADIGTLAKKIEDSEEIFDPNVVKTVYDKKGYALYFSRSAIPFYRDESIAIDVNSYAESVKSSSKSKLKSEVSELTFYKHIGIYCYRRNVLLKLTKLPQSRLEKAEKLEQLRALENGFTIKVHETDSETIGVDTPADLERVEKWLNTYS